MTNRKGYTVEEAMRALYPKANYEVRFNDATRRLFAQGARCGHLEGKGRAGNYTIDEEFEPSEVAANVNTSTARDANQWAAGYRHGYKLACEGEALESELVNEVLP
jgi:hypothetical protein